MRHILTASLILLLSACSPASPIPPSALPPTAIPAASPTAADTPEPIATLQPSLTPPPTLTPTPLMADMGQVIFSENFDDLDFNFNVWGPKRVETGILVLDETPPDGPANGIYGIDSIPAGATTVVLFKTVGATNFNIGYHAGEYGTESLRRFSFNSGAGVWDLYNGNADSAGTGNYPVEDWNARQIEFDNWCYFTLTRTADGSIEARLWERDNPASVFRFQANLGPEWGAYPFTFFVDFVKGSFLLDEYQELQ